MPRLSRTRVRNQARRRKLVALRRRNRREQRAARKKGLSLCRSERKGLANDEIETAQALHRRHDTRDLAVDAYVAWREECVAVRTAYLAWRRARAAEAALAFDAYEAALDREEVAAKACPSPDATGWPPGRARSGPPAAIPPERPRSAGVSATRSGSTQAPAAPGASGEPTTAFVVSGGASLGALQVGMLHALYERGIVPDLLVATSVGALNSAFVASRPQTVTTARELGRVSRNLEREDVFPVSMSALIGGFCGPRNHLVPDRGLRRLVGRHVEFEDLAGAAVPLHLVTFDLVAGRELLLSMGSAVEAVVAAASIPGVFPPVEIADRCLFDGGVVNNIPISHAVELGADRIVVLPTRDPAGSPSGRRRACSTPPCTGSACCSRVGFRPTSLGIRETSSSSSSRRRTVRECNRPASTTPTARSTKR